ncbi:MAG: hypothetical protein ABI780_06630 [Ardenticatenales bacterium]
MSHDRLTEPDPEGHPPGERRLANLNAQSRAWGIGLPFTGSSARPHGGLVPPWFVGAFWLATGLVCLATGEVIVRQSPIVGWILFGIGIVGCVGGVQALRVSSRAEMRNDNVDGDGDRASEAVIDRLHPSPTQPPEIERFVEWQDHQYDPGHWTGGRIPPIYRSDRPNRVGWLLIFGGASYSTIILLISVSNGDLRELWTGMIESPENLLLAAVSVLCILSGVRLVRGPRRVRRPTRQTRSRT